MKHIKYFVAAWAVLGLSCFSGSLLFALWTDVNDDLMFKIGMTSAFVTVTSLACLAAYFQFFRED